MKNRIFISAVLVCCFTILYADVPLPKDRAGKNICVAFMPDILVNSTVLSESDAEKLANSKTFGQDVIPQGEKKYWTVYSDRSNNKTYQKPDLKSSVEKRDLILGEKLRIAKIEQNFALVYSEPKPGVKYPEISDQAVSLGWIPMDNLLLWSTCPANDKGIYNKALITMNMDNYQKEKKARRLQRYENPEELNLSDSVRTGMRFYFIMKKHPNGLVLLSTSSSLDHMVGDRLYGWVDYETHVPWNQRSCIEPNWEIDEVERMKNDAVEIKTLKGDFLYRYPFGTPYTDKSGNPLTGPDKYRMNSLLLRYPILDNDSGDENKYKCTTFGIIGETDIRKHLDELGKTREDQEKQLEEMSKLNMIFVIDGTRSMGKYFPAVKDAIKEGCKYLEGDSKQNQYTPKVGLVIYRDYSDGEEGLIEYLPMSKVDDALLMEYLDNAGKYGAKSSSTDRTNEEALYKGLEMALDTLKMGYSKNQSNLMMVIGDCGNDENDTKCLKAEEILNKLVENKINLMTFQVRRNEAQAWRLFYKQMCTFQKENVQAQYDQLGGTVKVIWKNVTDGLDVVPVNNDSQFYVASIRRHANTGVDIEISKLTNLMERSIQKFENAISLRRRALQNVGSDAPETRTIDESFVKALLGAEGYERAKRERQFMAVTGYTDKTTPAGVDYWKSVIFISREELIELISRLDPVSKKANQNNRKEYVAALKHLVKGMLPGITDEEMAQKSTGEIMALITGLNAKSAALSGPRLVDIQDPTVINNTQFKTLVEDFKDKYRNLRGIREDKDYKYIHKSDGSIYYWIPVDQLP